MRAANISKNKLAIRENRVYSTHQLESPEKNFIDTLGGARVGSHLLGLIDICVFTVKVERAKYPRVSNESGQAILWISTDEMDFR